MGARRYPLGGRVDGTDGRTLSLYQTVCGGGFGTGLACDSTDRRQSRRCPTITYVPPPWSKAVFGSNIRCMQLRGQINKEGETRERERANGRVSFNMIILTSSEGSTQSSPSAVQCQ